MKSISLIYVLCQTDKESQLAFTSLLLWAERILKRTTNLQVQKCEKVSDKMKGKVVMQSQVKYYF